MYNVRTILGLSQKQYPDFDVHFSYQAALPIYCLKTMCTTMKIRELSVISRFILRAVALDIIDLDEICEFLGLQQNEVLNAGTELLQNGLIRNSTHVINSKRTISITDKGRMLLEDEKKIRVLQRRFFRVLYNPFSNQLESSNDELVDRTQVLKQGMFTLPTPRSAPKITSEIDLENFKDVIADSDRLEPQEEIIEINKLYDPYIEYRPDINIVVLNNRTTEETKILAFDGTRLLDDESSSLEKLFLSGRNIIPVDADDYREVDINLKESLPSLSESESKKVSEIYTLNKGIRIADLERAKETQIITSSNVFVESDSKAKLNELQKELESTKRQLREKELELIKETQNTVRIINTEEHNPLLKKALRESCRELIVISAFIGSRVMDEEFFFLFSETIKRGVDIKIAWGLGTKKSGAERERKLAIAKPLIARLREISKTNKGRLVIKEIETHEKILVCDSSFVIFGGFNWLSYKGAVDEDYRRETSMYSERSLDIQLLRNRPLEIFN